MFSDRYPKSILIIRNKKRYQLWFEHGTRGYGATKIARKHLIDGQNAQTGGFTLEELNRDIADIISNGNLSIKGNNIDCIVHIEQSEPTVDAQRS